MNNRLTPLALSAILPLFLFSWFVPLGGVQVDLFVLWAVAMTIVGLPMLLLEFALAERSQKSVWQGMQVLTREADAKTHWRVFSALSVLASFVIAGGLVSTSGEILGKIPQIGVPAIALSFGLMVASLILSFVKGRLLMLGAIAFIISGIVSLAMGNVGQIGVTDVGLKDWAVAVLMTVGSLGVGTGLYWLSNTSSQDKKPILKKALPIWLTQFAFGSLAFAVHSFGIGDVAKMGVAVGAVLTAGFFIYAGASELISRFGLVFGVIATAISCLILSAVPSFVFGWAFIVVAGLSALSLTVFAGFVMKISHLRKSLNFKTELSYNLWRIAVRLVVPIAIVTAWIGWAMVAVK